MAFLILDKPPVQTLYQDDFGQAEAAPLATPHNAPGGGTATITGSLSSIEEGLFKALSTAGASPGAFTLDATYTGAGLAIIGKVRYNASGIEFGVGIELGAVRASANPWIYSVQGSYDRGIGAWTQGVFRKLMFVRGGAGEAYFVDLDTRQLLFVSGETSSASISPLFTSLAVGNAQGDCEFIRVARLGAPWLDSYGLAMVNLTSPSIPSTQTGEADAVFHVGWSIGSGETLDILFRRTDDDNCWIVRCAAADAGANPDTIKLIEKIAGVETVRGSSSETFSVSGTAVIMITAIGTTIRAWRLGTYDIRINYTTTNGELYARGFKVMNVAAVTTIKCFPANIGRLVPRGV